MSLFQGGIGEISPKDIAQRFTQRMQAAGMQFIVFGPYDGSGIPCGIVDLETMHRVPAEFGGYIWKNRLKLIGPALRGDAQNKC